MTNDQWRQELVKLFDIAFERAKPREWLVDRIIESIEIERAIVVARCAMGAKNGVQTWSKYEQG